jgi:hypothetical protein
MIYSMFISEVNNMRIFVLCIVMAFSKKKTYDDYFSTKYWHYLKIN